MSEDLVKVRLDDDLQAVLRLMLNKEIGGVPVMDGDVLVGIFTERELIKFMAKQTYSGLVDSVMSTDLKVIDEHEDTLEASKMMQRYKVRRLPVVSNGRLVGIITAADIVKSLARTLDPKPVLEAGTRNPITVGRYETLMRIVRIMEERRIGTIPVVENEIVGIVTERDLLYATVTSGIS
jgi:CBS domain-containing protein